MKVSILLVCSYLLSIQSFATEVYGLNINQGKIKLSIHEVEMSNLDEIVLYNKNRKKMSLVCSNNSFYDAKISLLRYRNFYNIPVADFVLTDEACFYLHKFLTATFEAISEEYPVKIQLDIKSKIVESIYLPPLDPYWDGGEDNTETFENEEKLNNLNNPPLASN